MRVNDAPKQRAGRQVEPRWRGPTLPEIARACGLGTATVDRVLNGRGGVREVTRQKVLGALAELGNSAKSKTVPGRLKIGVVTESGASFNRSLEEAVAEFGQARADVEFTFKAVMSSDLEPVEFTRLIEQTAEEVDGFALVAREDLTINRGIRAVTGRGIPVVCLTTDLPSSGRLAYIGSDQTGAGATAAYLMGRVIGGRTGTILLVVSAPYRCQEERESGFRRVLRSEFTNLEVDERVNSQDDVEHSYRSVRKYIQEHGPPLGIYNVAAGNLGIARAVLDEGLAGKVVFVGHELNPNSRMLLETGGMDFVVGHDLDRELTLSFEVILAHFEGRPAPRPAATAIRVYTKYSCS